MSRGLTSFRRAQDNGRDIYVFPVANKTKLSDQTLELVAKLSFSKNVAL